MLSMIWMSEMKKLRGLTHGNIKLCLQDKICVIFENEDGILDIINHLLRLIHSIFVCIFYSEFDSWISIWAFDNL